MRIIAIATVVILSSTTIVGARVDDNLGYADIAGPAEVDMVRARMLAREVGDNLCVARPDQAEAECKKAFDTAEAHFAWSLVGLRTADLFAQAGKNPAAPIASASELFTKGQELYREAVKKYDLKVRDLRR